MPRILIVEDDRNTLSGLLEILGEEGYEVKGVDSGHKALRVLERERFDILLTDFKMPEIDGMQLYEQTQAMAPEMKTVVMTAYSSVKDAVEAMKRGVYEYLTKPLNLDELFVILKKAIDDQNLRRENEELKDRLQGSYRFESIIGKSAPMQQVFKTIVKVAKSQATVLIRGESGTGKELVARAVHYNSPRASGPMVEISCAAFPETLLESELFGYEKGAFTGADARKKGRFEVANGGTIFLDEIGDVSENVQTKLLRVLQEKEISRLGSNESIKVDARVITRHQSRSRAGFGRRQISRGSLLSPECHSDFSPAAARASRGHSLVHRLFHQTLQPAEQQNHGRHFSGSAGIVSVLRMAGQRAGIGKCGGERGCFRRGRYVVAGALAGNLDHAAGRVGSCERRRGRGIFSGRLRLS
jgi:CheY-like chemotaxis protein